MNPRATLWTTTIILALAITGLTLSLVRMHQSQPASASSPNYTVHMFNVGQGDAIFVEEADGTQILIDGGPDATVLSELGRVMKPWDRTIDLVIATHPHADHITGLIEVLDRYQVAQVLFTPVSYDSRAWDQFIQAAAMENATVPNVNEPLTEYVSILYPTRTHALIDTDDVNESSFIIQVDDGTHVTLLTGDAGDPVEKILIEAGVLQDIDVLKVGHHGSTHSTSRAFLDAVRPEHALISSGENNDYHHPHLSALRRLQFAGAQIWRTDLHGTVTVKSYPDRLEVR